MGPSSPAVLSIRSILATAPAGDPALRRLLAALLAVPDEIAELDGSASLRAANESLGASWRPSFDLSVSPLPRSDGKV